MINTGNKARVSQLETGPSRRTLLGGAAAVGIATGLGSMSSGFAAEPKKGGKLKVGLGEGSTTDSLDPATYTDLYMISVSFATHSTLTEIAPNGELVGDAAEDWEASADASQWTFRLRDNVTYSDGSKLKPQDVIASVAHHQGEDSKSGLKDTANLISEMKAKGDDSVVFVLQGPNADFPYLMADYHLPIMPANEDGTANWQDYIGTGGYTLESFEPGVRATLKKRDDYWKEGRAHFDEIELLAITDSTARQNAVATGEVDIISRCDLKTVNLLKRRPGVRVEEATGFLHYTAPMHTNAAPYDDNELRLAIKHSIDRQELVDKILYGHGTVGNDHPIAPSVPFWADLEQRTQDIDKAKYHLKKSNYSGETLELSAADAAFTGAVDASILMQQHLSKAGINVDVKREPADGYWSNVWLKKPWSACYWGGRPTCDWMFTQAYAAGANWNDTYFEHDKFNKLLKAGRGELDHGKRGEIYAEMQSILKDDGGALIWGFANYVYAMRDTVKHGEDVAANWELDGGRYLERWWFG